VLKTAKLFFICLAVFFLPFFIKTNKDVFAQTATQTATFDLNPEQKDPATYNILPLVLNPNAGNSTYETLLTNMLMDQGYEAHCAQKEWLIDAQAWGDIVDYFAEFPNSSVDFSGTSPQYVNFENARIPLLRGMEASELTDKNDSFEGMFGANLHEVFTELDYENATGVTGRLLSSYWQCFYKKNNLDAIAELCNNFFIDCFLNKEVEIQANPTLNIPAANLDYMGIKERLDNMHPELSSGNKEEKIEKNSAICIDLYPKEDSTVDADPAIALNRAAIEKVNFDLDNLYRLAFLVLVPRQSTANNKLGFVQSNGGLSGQDAPIVIAFKIPEFATNKSQFLDNIDSAELTKLVLQGQEENILDFEEQNSKRTELNQAAARADSLPEENKIIQCAGMSQCQRTDSNVLTNVLVDIINGTEPTCQTESISIIELEDPNSELTIEDVVNTNDLNFEKAGDLFTPAVKYFDDTARNPYKNNPLNNELLDQLDSKAESNFSWNIAVDSPGLTLSDEEKVSVRAYLVLPMGETVKDVNKAFSIFWNRDALFELIKSNVLVDMDGKTGAIPKYYTIKNSNVNFTDSDSYSWQTNCRLVPDPSGETDIYGNPIYIEVCDEKSFGVTVSGKPDNSLLFPDFSLGWFIKKIQTTIRSTADDAYKYVASCERVEDLFLGRCSGRLPGELEATCEGVAFSKVEGLPEYATIPDFAKENFETYVAPQVTQELIDVYGQVEADTGIPCEIVAGIHWMEGGMNPDQSLLDGGPLRGTLLEDATIAMEHLKDKMGMSDVAPDQIQLNYETLLMGLARYNGPGNANCTSNYLGEERPTRWRSAGYCPVDMEGDDHIYPVNWIDDKHQEMDLIFCMDTVEFTCNRTATQSDYDAIYDRYTEVMGRAPTTDFMEKATTVCFMGGGTVCSPEATNNNTSKYPLFERLGVLTTALIMNHSQ
jgi:hypothetical protein